ncbi:MAG: metal-sensing transcriptional repressor [Magnetococcales bacterium]|nr:metal-sensing transcriptional repressor [Magnetococcales bacterium]
MNTHPHHPAIVARLKRASGHLQKVISMIENDHPCEQVAQQLHAVCNALDNAKRNYVSDHIEHCLVIREGLSIQELEKQLTAMKQIAKYL